MPTVVQIWGWVSYNIFKTLMKSLFPSTCINLQLKVTSQLSEEDHAIKEMNMNSFFSIISNVAHAISISMMHIIAQASSASVQGVKQVVTRSCYIVTRLPPTISFTI